MRIAITGIVAVCGDVSRYAVVTPPKLLAAERRTITKKKKSKKKVAP